MRLILVSGTHGAAWSAAFRRLLEQHGIEVLCSPEWDEEVEGTPSLFKDRKHAGWIAGGYGFMKDAEDHDYADRIYLAHSYGGNVCAYGLARKACPPIRRLITIGTPNREDMRPIWEQARRKIGFHVHICDPKVPWIERAAQIFDGRFGNARNGHPTADRVAFVEGMKHSRILTDEKGMVAEWTKPRAGGALINWLTADQLAEERPAGTF